jgi:hypothetical protein
MRPSLSWFFKRKQAPSSPVIAHDPHLLLELHLQHEELLRMFVAMLRADDHNDHQECMNILERFRHALEDHLKHEDARLYSELRLRFPNSNWLDRTANDMVGIGLELRQFTNTYTSGDWTPERQARFRLDLRRMSKLLESRIKEEEQRLYKIYEGTRSP